jgi:uncharacterized 2Fe-2S/4Fe-4S cluster protein (DUF4445 family)
MKLELKPKAGERLADQLFHAGVEFPCGGESACGGCRIRVLNGVVPVTEMMRAALTEEELAAGWRLACCAMGQGAVTVEVDQWSVHVLTDEAEVPIEPRAGLGAVIDLGTTTLVAQLVDLESGEVLGVETGLNAQARYGADVMSRIQYELKQPGELRGVIRGQLGEMLGKLAGRRGLEEILIAGNTAMHHLFCGLSVEPLAAVPFLSSTLEERRFTAAELGWPGPAIFLGCLGGFVGSDLLTGIVATRLDKHRHAHGLFDIGTNGEIVVGSRDGIRCASTAAGPAFEGGRIGMGMRAGDGAIDSVHVEDGGFRCHVLGGVAPRGICGSGLVDAVAAGLQLKRVQANGRLADGEKTMALVEGVHLKQSDIRELQLAKGAMAAGLRMLGGEVRHLSLAGAFGNYIRQASARVIGLLPEDVEVEPVGNSALRGARMLLLEPGRREARLERILKMTTHVELASSAEFQDIYAESMALRPYGLR